MSLISSKEAKKLGGKSDVTEGTAVDVSLRCMFFVNEELMVVVFSLWKRMIDWCFQDNCLDEGDFQLPRLNLLIITVLLCPAELIINAYFYLDGTWWTGGPRSRRKAVLVSQ